jgi:hypothetical protein
MHPILVHGAELQFQSLVQAVYDPFVAFHDTPRRFAGGSSSRAFAAGKEAF